ncbi:MAG: hypothetical protein M3O02_10695 [Acidobacteriota bacterium]|nr:hypothetical protein [Acidobacteriota bacterium]
MSCSALPIRIRDAAREYAARPLLDLAPEPADAEHALTRYLLFVLIPLWTTTGLLDWYFHKKTDIEHTAGIGESLLHLLMFTEVGVPLILGMICEINAGLLSAMAGAVVVHSATAWWDVAYATDTRLLTQGEQHVHGFTEVLPIMALTMTASLHYDQVRAIFGRGPQQPEWALRIKSRRLPFLYLGGLAGLIVAAIGVPFANEIWRCWRARDEPHYNGAALPQTAA